MEIRVCDALTVNQTEREPKGGIHLQIFEILYIMKGRARFHWAEHKCEVDAPAVFLVSPATPHLLENIGEELECCFLELTDMTDGFFTTPIVDRWNMMQGNEEEEKHNFYMENIRRSLQFISEMFTSQKANWHKELHQACLFEVEKIFKLMTHIMLMPSYTLEDGEKNRWSTSEAIEIVINFMEWRYKDEITLKMLAEMVYLTPSYLVRVFKKHKGFTPIDYLMKLRMNAAASYLIRTNLPINTIIERTGFNSVHYFCRIFKKTYGSSPTQWRTQHRP